MGWKLSDHVCDEAKEVWDPLARYLASFANHSKAIEKSEFAFIYKTIVRLQSAITQTDHPTSTPRDVHSVARIAIILGQLAQDADCLDEALKLFREAVTPLSDGQCLALATVHCKIASLHFQRFKSSSKPRPSEVASAVSDAAAALGLQLKGSANDLDELLVEAAKLKKISMAWLGDAVTKDPDRKVEGHEVYDQIRKYLRLHRHHIAVCEQARTGVIAKQSAITPPTQKNQRLKRERMILRTCVLYVHEKF